jgi:cytochrome b involved in lipid metabolism
MAKTFTPADVAKHDQKAKDGMYIIVDSSVYDVTNFVDEHPGGAKILKRVAGKDASKQFWKVSFNPTFYTYSERESANKGPDGVVTHRMCIR